ncbi:TPH domain-containing protein [Durusdinium trenchii]|uniref:TPH domain-containing protein n=1 Tax=Durusdinium trenchii TaxID=1381693 RepID=A0ABP0HEZ1_9DINO
MPRVVSAEELEAIKGLVAPARKTDGDRRREEKQALSQARMKRWPDTIEAQRNKKEEAYKERMRRNEAERMRLDQEDDERRALERKAKIEHATKTIYRSTDKVKRLSSAELLSDCLYVREKQVHLNHKIKEAEKDWQAQFLVMEKERMERMAERERKEKDERHAMAKHVAEVQQEQLAEVRQRYVDQLKEQEAEGVKLIEAAKRAEEEEIEKQRQLQEFNRRSRMEVVKANEELQKLKALDAAKEAEEDAKIAKYAADKEALKQRQQKQFAKIENAKAHRRQVMIDQGTRRLQEINQANNSRLDNEVREAQRIEDDRVRRLAERRKEFERTIDESRQTQIEYKRRDAEEAAARDEDAARRWREHNAQAEVFEKMEEEAEFRAAREYQQILLNQAQEKREREIEEKREQIFEARALETLADKDLEEFKRTAHERIEAVKAAGKNPYPLLKCLNDVSRGR